MKQDTCTRCGHAWYRASPKKPSRCAGCGTRYWSVPVGVLRRGRPPFRPAKRTIEEVTAPQPEAPDAVVE